MKAINKKREETFRRNQYVCGIEFSDGFTGTHLPQNSTSCLY